MNFRICSKHGVNTECKPKTVSEQPFPPLTCQAYWSSNNWTTGEKGLRLGMVDQENVEKKIMKE